MNQQEFNGFVRLIDDAYPKQKKLNTVQVGFYWIAFKDESLEDCLKALSNHTKTSEWKPQVCDITKNMDKDENYATMFLQYINRNKPKSYFEKDKNFMRVVQIMGEKRIRTMLESEVENMTEKFVDLYKLQLNNAKYDSLPNKVKQKLIGVCKR